MKQNDDGETVRAMDILFPLIGEIVGGSQREEDLHTSYQRGWKKWIFVKMNYGGI